MKKCIARIEVNFVILRRRQILMRHTGTFYDYKHKRYCVTVTIGTQMFLPVARHLECLR